MRRYRLGISARTLAAFQVFVSTDGAGHITAISCDGASYRDNDAED